MVLKSAIKYVKAWFPWNVSKGQATYSMDETPEISIYELLVSVGTESCCDSTLFLTTLFGVTSEQRSVVNCLIFHL